MIGRVLLNHYRVLRLLGEGGMSKVYLGMQTDPPREVAIKVVRDELLTQAKIREHFKREVHILSRFKHPHAVAFFEADTDGKQPFFVMEYLRGTDLGQLLVRHRHFTPERAGRFLGQMCSVLHAAHDDCIIHRDVKPDNFMVVHPDTAQEKVKLMDFGLAKMTGLLYIAPEELINLRRPTASGTPEYISPEQVRGNEVDRRADVYSLGIILYEMLAGRRPFDTADVNELLLAHQDERPPTFAEVGAPGAISPKIEAVVRSCLEKYPEDRPATAEALAHRFEEALGKKIYEKSGQPVDVGSLPGVIIRKMEDKPKAPAVTAADRHAIVKHLTASMPESMAMVKLKGFIHDLGGEILESVPGMIRVRIADPAREKKAGGLFGWLGGGSKTSSSVIRTACTLMELGMEKLDPNRPNQLSITLKLTSPKGSFDTEGRARCERICRDLQAYLIGR